jgi:hypothetical protein
MKNYLLLASTVAILLVSCEHEDYADQLPGVPVFSITGLRNGQPFSLAAGKSGLIQTANLERNKYGVLEWSSSFVDAGCVTCEPVFRLTINDADGMTYENSANSNILANGELSFASAPSDSGFTTCSFALVYPGGNANFQQVDYHINNGPPVNDFPVTLDPGINIVEVDFDLDDEGNNQQYSIRQTIFAGSHSKLSEPFRFRYEENEDENLDHLHLFIPQQFQGGLRADGWETSEGNFNPGDVSIPLTDEGFIRLNFYNDEINQHGYYEISWVNEPEIFEYEEEDDNENTIKTAPAIQATWQTGELNHEKVFIEYYYNGKHYTSVNPNQTAIFTIAANHQYSSTDASAPNRQIEANFSITLYEVGNAQNTIELTGCKGTFGFFIPQ